MLVKPTTYAQKAVYHQTFELQQRGVTISRHTLLVNPEDMSQAEPARVNVMQTLGGAYVDDFGAGLPQITISGITGYKARFNTEGLYVDGYEEFVNFRRNIYRNFIESNNPNMSLIWYNWEDNEFYQVQPTNFRLQRNARQPLLYRYEFQFICIGRRGTVFGIFDKLLSSPSVQVIGSLIAGGRAKLGSNLLKMGLSGALGKALGKTGGTLAGTSAKTMTAVGMGTALLSGKSKPAAMVALGSAIGESLTKAKSKVSNNV